MFRLFILILFFACASEKKAQLQHDTELTVDVDSENYENKADQLVIDTNISGTNEHLSPGEQVLADRAYETYVDLYFNLPGIESLSGIGIISTLKKNKIGIGKVSGRGLGRVIGLLFNQVKNIKKIEWLIFKSSFGLVPFKNKKQKEKLKKKLFKILEKTLYPGTINSDELKRIVDSGIDDQYLLDSCEAVKYNFMKNICVSNIDYKVFNNQKIELENEFKNNSFSLSDYKFLGEKMAKKFLGPIQNRGEM